MNARRSWVLFVMVLLSGIVPAEALAQAGGHPAAAGQAVLVREDGSLTVSFSATGQTDGTAAGLIDLHDPAALPDQDVDGTGDVALVESSSGVAVRAEVNCLVVDGDTAIVGGQVTHSSLPRYLGKQVLLFVEDSSNSGGRFGWGFYERSKNVFCDSYPWAAYSPQKIAEGSLRVQQ